MNRRNIMQMIGASLFGGKLALPVQEHDLSVPEFYDIEKHLVQDEGLGLAVKTTCDAFEYSLVPYENCFQLIKFGVLEKQGGRVVESGPFIALFVRLNQFVWERLLDDVLQKDQDEYTPLPTPIVYARMAITPDQFKELKQAARYIAYSHAKSVRTPGNILYRTDFSVYLLDVTDVVQRYKMTLVHGIVSVEKI